MCLKIKINLEWRRSWRRRRRLVVLGTVRPKRGCTCIITHPWSNLHDHLTELIIIHWESFILLFQGHELLRLGARYWWKAPNGWDTTGWPQVFGRSVREPVDPIIIGSTRRSYLHLQIQIKIQMGRRIIPISLPQPAIIDLLIFFLNHHIQFKKITTYEIKWLNEHTMKCWARLSTNYCTPFWRSWLRMCVSTNSSIGLGSCPRDVACKEKKGCKLNIFISNNKLINDIFHLN
jgi:hypothetical protein